MAKVYCSNCKHLHDGSHSYTCLRGPKQADTWLRPGVGFTTCDPTTKNRDNGCLDFEPKDADKQDDVEKE